MATLKQIGLELGLSPATVSRALNGFPEVNQHTRDKVREVADRLGYRPNRVAQRLVTGRSGMVGMILKIRPDMSADQTFFEMLTGLTAALAAHDVDLVLSVDQGKDPVKPYAKMMERDILDGFILNAPTPHDPRVDYLRQRNIPFVLHGQTAPDVDYTCYGIDNAGVSRAAVELLVSLGHQRIALLNGPLQYAFAHDRRRGFVSAMEDRKLPVPTDFISGDNETEAQGYAAALAMLAHRQHLPPTAIVCGSTLVAAGAMRAVRDKGLQVPTDVSIVAHDDALPQLRAVNFSPALTVTRAPLRDACQPLADLLIALIKGAKPRQQIEDAELIVRESTGPVPTSGLELWP
ncbi:substrate-binding domain-containing protein [Yoonia litorea]|uniref:Transcriptional regulator, LacI family n=1 Tax=Yoonia litorea TaxID=1123755 RepID=A0A1I6N0P2_9RHOB|nr:substrate-binding domain-containing protein [Yoonia litorea]SFS21535.1 transcriptional regulator, LacI family [Yoonia litorea]